MKQVNKLIQEFYTRFRITKEMLFQKYLPMEYKIYRYAFQVILNNMGISKRQIQLLIYNKRGTFAVKNSIKTYNELINIPGNIHIKEFVNSYK